ncbi:MAG: ACP S-malonyltransferase [Arenicellales bacterium]|nr:ACP S-malonyltransferase [Arenicellales bacterium]
MTLDAQPVLFIFPGQGSQYPGMGKDLFDAFSCVRDVYAEASDVLGYDIAALSFDDPKDQIHLTRFTQPALLTHSIACLNIFQEQLSSPIIPRATAGHSLGEYSALVASGALDFASALQLVNERGRLMGELGEGEMEALPLEFQAAKHIAEQHYCAVAACNLPDQTVVGGRAADLDSLIEQFGIDFPGKRSARLKTEGAFHTFYMIKTAMQFRSTLATAPFQSPAVSVLSNASGTFHTRDPDAIRAALFIQLFSPVLWNANLNHAVENGCQTIIEFGGGIGKGQSPAEKKPNLAGIVKKTFRRHDRPPQYSGVINIDTLEKSIALCTT